MCLGIGVLVYWCIGRFGCLGGLVVVVGGCWRCVGGVWLVVV